MIVSNNNIYVVKCYIKFFYIVADKMQGLPVLAEAITDFILCKFKKNNNKNVFIITHFHPHISQYNQLISL